VQIPVAIAQVQPLPEIPVIARPGGGISVTVTTPLDGELPTFETVTVYVIVCPAIAMLGVCVFVMVRSLAPDGGGSTTTPSVSRDPRAV
jgi:hypothetical protein